MTEPSRLLDEPGTTPLSRSLLSALADEAPSPAARARTLAAMGLATGAAASVGAGAATGAAHKALGALAWAKWVGGALVAVTLAGGGAYVASSHAARTADAPAPHAALTITTSPVRAASDARETATSPTSTTAAPTVDVPVLAAADLPLAAAPTSSTGSGSPSARPRGGALGAELSLIDRARQAFARGDYAGTVQGVNAYESRYPRGAFEQEAEFLRVRALFAQNDLPRGRAAGAAFLTQHPSSPYAEKVRALVGSGP